MNKQVWVGVAVIAIAASAGVGGFMLYKHMKTPVPAPPKMASYTIARDMMLDEDENVDPYYLRAAPRPLASSGRCASMNTPTTFRY